MAKKTHKDCHLNHLSSLQFSSVNYVVLLCSKGVEPFHLATMPLGLQPIVLKLCLLGCSALSLHSLHLFCFYEFNCFALIISVNYTVFVFLWLCISLSTICSRLSSTVTSEGWMTFHWMDGHILFIHSPTNGYSGCFHSISRFLIPSAESFLWRRALGWGCGHLWGFVQKVTRLHCALVPLWVRPGAWSFSVRLLPWTCCSSHPWEWTH